MVGESPQGVQEGWEQMCLQPPWGQSHTWVQGDSRDDKAMAPWPNVTAGTREGAADVLNTCVTGRRDFRTHTSLVGAQVVPLTGKHLSAPPGR